MSSSLTPEEYDLLLGKFVVLGKAVELLLAGVEDGMRTLTALRPGAVPARTPIPEAPMKVRVTKTLGGGQRERILNPDEIAEQATAPARNYISQSEDGSQGTAGVVPSAKGAGKNFKTK